jgi:hypothetical protein
MIRSRLVISIAGLFFLLISGCNSNNTETPLIPTDGTSTPTVESFQTPDITSTPTDGPDFHFNRRSGASARIDCHIQ